MQTLKTTKAQGQTRAIIYCIHYMVIIIVKNSSPKNLSADCQLTDSRWRGAVLHNYPAITLSLLQWVVHLTSEESRELRPGDVQYFRLAFD